MVLEKYSGSGNDFLITHKLPNTTSDSVDMETLSLLAQKLCHRQNGIGADGMIIIRPHPTYAYQWIFLNSDGSEAKMCGNASRCVAHYAYRHKLAKKAHAFYAGDRAIEVKVKSNDRVLSNLGNYSSIRIFQQNSSYNDQAYFVDTGVPHLVIFTKDKNLLPTEATEELKELRMRYDANINIVFIKSKTTLMVHTYERGVEDITLACGTGMAASSVVGNLLFRTSKTPICIPPSQETLHFFIQDKNISFEGNVSHIAKCTVPDRFFEQKTIENEKGEGGGGTKYLTNLKSVGIRKHKM